MTMVTTWVARRSGGVINISDRLVSRLAISPSTSTPQYNLNSTGTVTNHLGTVLENWISPQVGMSGYEAMATQVSGTAVGGTLGAWLNLGTTRSWFLTRSGVGTNSAVITVQIRVAGGAVLDSATISFEATVEPA